MKKKKHPVIQARSGMSLIEAIMAVFIFSVCIAGFTLLFLRSWTTNSFILEEGQTAFLNQRAVDNVVNDIRRARQADNGDYPLEAGDDDSIMFYVDTDGDGTTERVHYFLENETLKKGVTEPVAGTPVTYPNGDQSVAVVATAVVNTAADPVFSYYNADYPGDVAHNPIATPIAVENVRLVRVHVLMNIDPEHAPDNLNIESFAELRNLNEYVQ